MVCVLVRYVWDLGVVAFFKMWFECIFGFGLEFICCGADALVCGLFV